MLYSYLGFAGALFVAIIIAILFVGEYVEHVVKAIKEWPRRSASATAAPSSARSVEESPPDPAAG